MQGARGRAGATSGRVAPVRGLVTGVACALLLAAAAGAGCASTPEVRTAPDLLAAAPSPGADTTGSPDVGPLGPVPVWPVRVLERWGHDPSAFTQGLELHEGRLYESRGRYGSSALTEIDPRTGAVLRALPLGPEVFGEGLTVVGDRIAMLSWKEGRAFLVDRETLGLDGERTYGGEGWGLCHDGEHLVMSDGSNRLEFRDPQNFEVRRSVEVQRAGQPVGMLNELECVGDRVYANVWKQDALVAIDAATGEVEAVFDARGLLSAEEAARADVLNGIAHDETSGTFLLTGKYWPAMFEVILDPPDARP